MKLHLRAVLAAAAAALLLGSLQAAVASDDNRRALEQSRAHDACERRCANEFFVCGNRAMGLWTPAHDAAKVQAAQRACDRAKSACAEKCNEMLR